jgi:hypothetical protein
MKKNSNRNINDLKEVIRQIHKCEILYSQEIAVVEKYGDKTVWSGVVHVFNIVGHPKTDTCYGWSFHIKGSKKRRYYTVLKIPPIDSPEKAVRASVVHNHKTGKL